MPLTWPCHPFAQATALFSEQPRDQRSGSSPGRVVAQAERLGLLDECRLVRGVGELLGELMELKQLQGGEGGGSSGRRGQLRGQGESSAWEDPGESNKRSPSRQAETS